MIESNMAIFRKCKEKCHEKEAIIHAVDLGNVP